MFENKEFAMTDADYRYISQTVYNECGIVLSDQKKDMVYSRLARRIRALKLGNFTNYIEYLTNNKEAEFVEFINAITTNLTSFFREPHHFDFLKGTEATYECTAGYGHKIDVNLTLSCGVDGEWSFDAQEISWVHNKQNLDNKTPCLSSELLHDSFLTLVKNMLYSTP